jgi:hypothetical protein
MMTIRAKLTPEVLLSAPRRSAGSPNSSGNLVLHTVSFYLAPPRRHITADAAQVSTYSFQEHKKNNSIQVLDIESNQATTLYTDSCYSEPTWVSDTEFLLIKSGERGTSSLVVADVNSPGASLVSQLPSHPPPSLLLAH